MRALRFAKFIQFHPRYEVFYFHFHFLLNFDFFKFKSIFYIFFSFLFISQSMDKICKMLNHIFAEMAKDKDFQILAKDPIASLNGIPQLPMEQFKSTLQMEEVEDDDE